MSDFVENRSFHREHARAALVNKEGLVRRAGDDERTVDPPIVLIVTNARLIFVTPDDSLGFDEGALEYGDIAEVTLDDREENLLTVRTCDGVCWRAVLPAANPDVLTAVRNHLRWIGRLRAETVRLDETTQTAADKIRDYASERDWDAAQAVYSRVRDDLDSLICDIQVTTTSADYVLAPELTDIERALEEAHVRLYIERSRSKLEFARHLVEHEQYENAAAMLQETRDLYETGRNQSETLQRGDAFQFGRQRDLRKDLDRLEWEIESVAAEPLRQARDATVRAAESEDTEAAIEHWEVALGRYTRIQQHDWPAIERDLAVDPEDIQQKRLRAVEALVALHTDLARERWNQAVYRQRAGDGSPAIDRVGTALTHLDRAAELAGEFEAADIDLADCLGWMETAISETDVPSGRVDDASQDRPPAPSRTDGTAFTRGGATGTGEDRPTGTGEDRPTGTGEDRPTGTGEDRPTETGEDRPTETGEDRPSVTPQSGGPDSATDKTADGHEGDTEGSGPTGAEAAPSAPPPADGDPSTTSADTPTLDATIPRVTDRGPVSPAPDIDEMSGVGGRRSPQTDSETRQGDSPATADDDGPTGAVDSEEWEIPSVEGLSNIDSHHDITLDLGGVDRPSSDTPTPDGGEQTGDEDGPPAERATADTSPDGEPTGTGSD